MEWEATYDLKVDMYMDECKELRDISKNISKKCAFVCLGCFPPGFIGFTGRR